MIEAVRFRGVNIEAEKEFLYALHNKNDRGWCFGAGDPEFWKYKDSLLVEGGDVLDLGIGDSRASMFFALQGMNVTGIDYNKCDVETVNSMASEFRLPMKAIYEDVRNVDFGRDAYDTVLMGQLFDHFPNKQEAFSVIDKALEAIKPNGHIWLRAIGKDDFAYGELEAYTADYPREVTRVDKDVFNAPCDCSGERKTEPYLFFGQTEILAYFNKKGFKIVHSQIVPRKGELNIMYGEDWKRDRDPFVNYGEITILAQK